MQQQPDLLAVAKEALAVLSTVPGTSDVVVARNNLRHLIRRLDEGFHAEDFAHTAELLRSPNEKIREATASNNHNIILAALDICATGRAQ